jgi:hypothetical protein
MRPLDQLTENPDFIIRPFAAKDREKIRFICCETGYLGNPIDSIFSDRDLFADYLTRYYTDIEPELSWVGEKDGEVVGYLIGCKRWKLNQWWGIWNGIRLAAKAGLRFITGRYDSKDRKFLKWIILSAWKETPPTPPESAHFHFNSLQGHRKMGIARDMVVTLIKKLREAKVPRVYGQMITYNNRRTEKVWEYLGWKVINKKKVTKYQKTLDKELFLTTMVMELNDEENYLVFFKNAPAPPTPPQ